MLQFVSSDVRVVCQPCLLLRQEGIVDQALDLVLQRDDIIELSFLADALVCDVAGIAIAPLHG